MESAVLTRQKKSDRELLDKRWTKQFLASGARLEEAKESYASLGFDVHLELAQTEDLACSECQPPQAPTTSEGWYVIYTRPRPSRDCQEDELW